MKQEIYPESFYRIDDNMSIEKVFKAKETGSFLVSTVLSWNPYYKALEAALGNGFIGIIPFEEITIYPMPKNEIKKASYISELLGQTICVCVQKVVDGVITLSRKANMKKALDILFKNSSKELTCCVKYFDRYGVFVDIGHGLSGRISLKNLSSCFIHSPSDMGIHPGQTLSAKILSYNKERNHFEVSHRETFENLNLTENLNAGDIIKVLVLEPVDKIKSGYYVQINPNSVGILNPKDNDYRNVIPFGTYVSARVRQNPKNGKIRLAFVSY